MSEPRPYSLAEHVYAGKGLDTLSAEDINELVALLLSAERLAGRPMTVGNVDRLIAACLGESNADPFIQWEHELVVDESLRAIVAMLLPPAAIEGHRIAYQRLRRAQGLGQ